MKGGSKGQFSIIVIIGVVLLIGIGLILVLRSDFGRNLPDPEEHHSKDPIRAFVDRCLQQVSKEAIIMVGEHGGYLDPYDPAYTGIQFMMNTYQPTNSDGLEPFGEGSFVPYWAPYLGGPQYHTLPILQ